MYESSVLFSYSLFHLPEDHSGGIVCTLTSCGIWDTKQGTTASKRSNFRETPVLTLTEEQTGPELCQAQNKS